MGAPPDLPLREQAEPTLNQVQPGRMGRREVQVIPRSAGKPSPNGRSLVGRIVVQHDVHLCRRGKLGIQMVEKFLKFARAMTSKTFSNNSAAGTRGFYAPPVPVASARWAGCDLRPEFDFSRPHKEPTHGRAGSYITPRCRALWPPERDRWRAERSGCDGAAVRRPSKCG